MVCLGGGNGEWNEFLIFFISYSHVWIIFMKVKMK